MSTIPAMNGAATAAEQPAALAVERAPGSWQRIRRDGELLEVAALAAATAFPAALERSAGHLHLITLLYPVAVLADLRLTTPAGWDQDTLLDGLRRAVTTSVRIALMLLGVSVLLGAHGVHAGSLWQWGGTLVLLVLVRLLTGRRLRRLPAAALRPTLVVGNGPAERQLAAGLLRDHRHGLAPVGFLEPPSARESAQAAAPGDLLPLLGSCGDLPQIAFRVGAECVVLGSEALDDEQLRELLHHCESAGLTSFVVPRSHEVIGCQPRIRTVGAVPLAEVTAPLAGGAGPVLKSLVDRVMAALLLMASAPLLVLIAVMVKLSSPGPVLFRQHRVSRDGREFTMLKFRTMRPAAVTERFEPRPGQTPGGVEGSDRRTRVGIWLRRCSLDELPQLINVLRGDMSIVGPRPERPEYVRMFDLTIPRYDRRHRVRSGITGLAQVCGSRGQGSLAERLAYDHAYISNWSLWLDLKIAIRTVKTVMSLEGE